MTAPYDVSVFENVIQPSLFDERIRPTQQIETSRDMTIKERFQAFHEANPHVAQALARMALALKQRGHDHFGMKALFETLRFQYALQTHDPTSDFKLNNDFSALYSRLLMREVPELEGFFETRQRRAQ